MDEEKTEENKDETDDEGEEKITPTDEAEQSSSEEPPCDPATMNCDEMRDRIIDLSGKRSTLDVGIKSLDETRKIIPSEPLDKAYDKSVEEKQKIDDEIYGLFERFTVCAAKPESEEKPTEEETPIPSESEETEEKIE